MKFTPEKVAVVRTPNLGVDICFIKHKTGRAYCRFLTFLKEILFELDPGLLQKFLSLTFITTLKFTAPN